LSRGTVADIRDEHGSTAYRVYTTVSLSDSEPAGDDHLTVVEDMDAVERVREAAADAGGRVVDIRTEEPSLEDLFLDIAGRELASDPRAEATR
jgi:ABC-2 type transport system ATP-binding protein